MSESTARVWQEPLTIPTYRLGPAERNPMFFAGRTYQGARGPIYPYPLLDKLSDRPEDKTYDAVYLENEYVKLTVLPEIGGRILDGVDKTNGYHFFYRQTVIKPALIGMLGAWISGGVEWNVPHHHRATTFMPVDYCTINNDDGSRSVWIGEIELRHRMKWIIGLTVYPGRSFVEVTIRVMNRTPFQHSMLYFTNAAVHVNDDYRVIFPPSVDVGTQHAKCEFIRWPVADTVYAGVDYTKNLSQNPLCRPEAEREAGGQGATTRQCTENALSRRSNDARRLRSRPEPGWGSEIDSKGVDVSWWKNHPNWVSIFAFDSYEDFFGGYDYGRDTGTCHYADHHVSPGKKFFEFGAGPGGKMWDKILTDSDGPYLELMAGAYSDNQPDYSWIQPYESRTVTEYWYPLRGIGGIKNANRDAAVNLDVNDKGTARFAFNTTVALDEVTILLKAGDKTLHEERRNIAPDKPFSKEIALPAGVKPESLRASLMVGDKEAIGYTPVKPKGEPLPKPVVPPAKPKDVKTNEELYLAGLRLEQFQNPALEPYPYYEEAIRRDPLDYRANTALGILYLKRGMYSEAIERLSAAVSRTTENYTRPKDGEAYYYLGVALKATGDLDCARDALNRAAWSFGWRAASYYELAEIGVREGEYNAAYDAIEHAIAFNIFGTKALNLKATILRRAGFADQAYDLATNVCGIDPLDFRARNERLLCLLALDRETDAEKELAELTRLMRGETQSYLELASDYEALGLWDEALDALWRLTIGRQREVDPIVHYTLGYYWENRDNAAEAAMHYRLGSQMPPDYCFPFRLESIRALESAIRHNAGDARAPYYLGNLLYDKQPENAIHAWERSREIDPRFATVHRNLAFAYLRAEKNSAKAAESLKKAVACDPSDPLLLCELDAALAASGVPHRERLDILEKNHSVVAKRDDALLRESLLHVFVGEYDRALELLDNHRFHIWEGGENSIHDVYVDAHCLRGRGHLAAGNARAALADFEAAAKYPDRFEMGEPYDGGRSAEVNYLIGLAHEALGGAAKAHAAFEAALAKDKRKAPLAYYQGLAHRNLGADDKAKALFDELIAVGSDALKNESGVNFFEKFAVSEFGPAQKAQAHYLIGLGLLGNGEKTSARAELETALGLNVNILGAQTMLASLG